MTWFCFCATSVFIISAKREILLFRLTRFPSCSFQNLKSHPTDLFSNFRVSLIFRNLYFLFLAIVFG